ncbi:MAG: BTAD domain-containing putative transcriptional regulator, partial [Nocardioidaceae bacterium]
MAAPASPRDTSLPTRETPRKVGNRRTSLEIGVLGPLRVRLSGALLPVAGARRRGIVSALAMADGQPVTAERLAHVLLGDNGARANVATMRTYLSKLRAELGSAAERLQTVDGGYVLDLDADEFDVRRFRALLGAARGASNPQLRLETADGALALWRGDPLVDLRDSAWGQAEIRALTSAWLEARKLRATAQLDLGDHVSVAAELEPVLAANPHREDLAGMLMVALYRSGRQAEALMLYPRLRDRIVSELGVEPGPALVDVHRAILRHDPALATGTGHAVTAIRQQPTPGPMPQRGVHRTTGRDQFPLAGREPELMLLETALHTAQQGRPGMILVTGEAGIGKSRLGQEFLALASTRGARVLTGLSLPAVLPYQPLADCLSQYVEGLSDEQLLSALGRDGADLARIVPELADRLPLQAQPISPETGRRQLARAVAGWFRAASRDAPLVLLLDDLEQIDRETAELISSALPSAGMHPVLVVAVARDTDLGIDHPLHHLSAALRRQGMLNLLPLGPLPPDALATLAGVAGVDSRPDAVATLTADTGGNAFLATQALMALAAREPQAASSARAGIAELIRERLSQLPDSTVEALTAAAVAGGRVPLHHLAAILALPVDETARRVAPAVAAHLLDEPSGGRYRFVHMLVRDALLDRLGPTLRAQAHRRLAEHLEALHANQPELVLDQLAHHHAAAVVADGDATKAVEFGLRAGVRAFEQFADEAALVRFRTAWEASCRGAPTSAELRRELLLRLGETEARLDRPTSYDTLLEAAAAAAAVGDNARVVRAALALAR